MPFIRQHQRPKAQSLFYGSVRANLDANSAETASYIADMAAELAEMADAAKLDVLAYFLRMAQMEAANIDQPQSEVDEHGS